MNFQKRIDEPEIMDTLQCSDEELRKALYFLEWTNRYFGGYRAILKHLDAYKSSWHRNETITFLDVGSGLADLDMKILHWGRARGFQVRITALEMVPQIARIAREFCDGAPNLNVEQGNILTRTFPEGIYDYVIASLFLHHIADEQLDPLLKKLDRIANRGMIFADLRRSLPAYWAVGLVSYLVGDRIVRHDGPLSVRRSFRIDELQDLADRNRLHYLKAKHEPFFRVSLAGEKVR